MKTLLRVLQYLRPYRLMVLGTFLFAGLTTAFELVPPWLIKILIDVKPPKLKKDPETRVRRAVADALGRIKPQARRSSPR